MRLFRLRFLLFAAAALLLPAALSALPYGPLFPWSPWKPGYRHYFGARGDVFCPSDRTLPPAYTHLDAIVRAAERYHGLAASKRVTVVICRNWGDCERFMPMLLRHGIGAITLPTGTVVYVTPRLDEQHLDHGEFLRHEISHCVLHQNQSLYAAWRIARYEWFTEGLAVSFARQKSFFTREQFLARAKSEAMVPWIDPALRRQPFDVRFGYVAWRYFVEYVMATGGRARFQEYMTACLAHPDDWRPLFSRTYGREFSTGIAAFQADLRSARWQPEGDGPPLISHRGR